MFISEKNPKNLQNTVDYLNWQVPYLLLRSILPTIFHVQIILPTYSSKTDHVPTVP